MDHDNLDSLRRQVPSLQDHAQDKRHIHPHLDLYAHTYPLTHVKGLLYAANPLDYIWPNNGHTLYNNQFVEKINSQDYVANVEFGVIRNLVSDCSNRATLQEEDSNALYLHSLKQMQSFQLLPPSIPFESELFHHIIQEYLARYSHYSPKNDICY